MLRDNHSPDQNDAARPLAWGLVLVAAVLAVGLRLLPYAPNCAWLFNFSLVGALGLYAGARLRSWHAFAIPLLVMASSDLVLRSFVPFSFADRLPVYGSYLAYVLLGRLLIARSQSPLLVGGTSLLGSLQFFLITNFVVFAASTIDATTIPGGAAWCQLAEPGQDWFVNRYANNVWGLLACYELALPFALKTVLSDLGFTALLFGAHAGLAHLARGRGVGASSPIKSVS